MADERKGDLVVGVAVIGAIVVLLASIAMAVYGVAQRETTSAGLGLVAAAISVSGLLRVVST